MNRQPEKRETRGLAKNTGGARKGPDWKNTHVCKIRGEGGVPTVVVHEKIINERPYLMWMGRKGRWGGVDRTDTGKSKQIGKGGKISTCKSELVSCF